MVTYYIEVAKTGNIFYYYFKLKDAKCDLLQHFKPNSAKIIKLVGQYAYEGYHQYALTWNGKKFKKEKMI